MKQNTVARRSEQRIKIWGYVLLGFWPLAGAIATAGDGLPVQWLNRNTQNLFFQLRGRVSVPNNIIILEIDDESMGVAKAFQDVPQMRAYLEPMKTWPWKRVAYANAVEQLMAAGARSVSLDLVFDSPSSYGEADDRQLGETLQRYHRRVALAASYIESDGIGGLTIVLSKPTQALQPDNLPLGSINILKEVDGRVHQLTSEYRQQKIRPLNLETIPSLAEATLQAAQLPYPKSQGSNIYFYGPRRTFERLPFYVLAPNNWNLYKEKFKDKIVLIGSTAGILQDFHTTPFGEMSGVEILANEIATLLEDRAIAEAIPSSPLRGLFVFVVVAVASALKNTLTKRTVARLFWGCGMAIIWGGIAFLGFTCTRLIFPAAIPAIAITLSSFSYFITSFIRDQLEKRRFRNTLERYVAAPVVQEILKQHDDYQELLKGRQLRAAILFSDIRGFTTLSSQLEPELLVEQLNIYLNAMVEEILEAGGTVDKFIGDAVMAEFGSPVSNGEKTDAMKAIRAALGMRKALAQLRQQWHQEGRVPLFNGIGINYGELIVGDIGSLRRREYAAIGDAVNVASRVEGLTKKFRTDILITESLYQLVKNEVEVIRLGEQEVRGRSGAVRLYSLISLKGESQALYQQVHEEFRCYLNQTNN
jgi:adenylate cyclase